MNSKNYLRRLPVVFLLAGLIFRGPALSQTANRLDSLEAELAASEPDTHRVRMLYVLYGETLYNDPDQALAYATRGRELSEKIGYRRGMVLGYEKIGGVYFNNSDWAKAKYYYDIADSLLQGMNWPRQQAVIYGNFAALYKDRAVYDSALWWNDRFMQIADELENDYFRGFSLTITGDIYHLKGQHNLAADNILQALRLYERLGDPYRAADAQLKLGEVQMAAGRYEDARTNLEAAAAAYRSLNDLYFAGQAERALGLLHYNRKAYDLAEPLFRENLVSSRELGDPYGVAQCEEYLGNIARAQANYDSAFAHYQRALPIYLEIGDGYNAAALRTSIAWIYYDQQAYEPALAEARRGETAIRTVGSPVLEAASQEVLYRIYSALGRPEAALRAFETFVGIQDSLYTVEKAAQLEELQLIYSIEKKDQEIELLAKDVQLGAVKQQRLLVGLVALALIAGLTIYLQYMRRQRDRRVAEETRRRRQAELERARLEKAQVERELTAQVLQLCRKNELLASVQQEIKVLGAQSNQVNKPSLKRLERSIQKDIQSDEDWRQFLSTFENVHPHFIHRLRERAEALTPAEQRLACLLKMNLSSKEIATLLNITDEGVKKGRYRLRKKLGVDSDVGLQDFLINFSGEGGMTADN